MINAFNKDFKPKIVPVLNGLDSKLLNNLQYPVCLQPLPSNGVSIVIRSGFLQIFTGTSTTFIKNLEFKQKLEMLIRDSRKLKVTLEGIVVSRSIPDEHYILSKLMDYSSNIDDLDIYFTDMVFEHTPKSIRYEIRARDMKILFRPDKVGDFPKFVENIVINSKKEFIDNIITYIAMGQKKFRIASPNSVYKFGEIDDLFSGNGGIVDIDSTTLYKAKLVLIMPKILQIKQKTVYSADTLVVEYLNQSVDIKLEEISIILATKIWENRNALLGNNVIFSGLYLPGYIYPKFRNFIRFEKK